jgi:Flp pilus assembly protein CpaB
VEHIQKLTSTRAGTIALATLAAIVAGGAILVYLNRYRDSVSANAAPVTVLVAKQPIQKGTPGTAIAASGFFTTSTIRQGELRDGAFSDPASLRGEVAVRDIYPGQQLTAADFTAGSTSLASSLTKTQRLITIPLDSAHGLIGQVEAGDHVDVYAGFNVIPLGPGGVPIGGGQARPMLRLVMQDVPVTSVEKASTGVGASATTNVTLRATNEQAEKLAFGSDNGKIWLVLRPAAGAKRAKPGLVTVETMLLGIPPITVIHSFGGHR